MLPIPLPKRPARDPPGNPAWQRFLLKFAAWTFGLACWPAWPRSSLVGGVALAVAYPNLPDIGDLADYRPKLPLRVFSADGVLIGEFGEERRNLTPIGEIPAVMKNAVLAIEDARFYEHSGVDYKGMMRAASPTWAGPRARAPPPSPCRWRATSTCRPRRPSRASCMKCC
jgi:penicillin-binding protein 1A